MASITKRHGKDGSLSYLIRVFLDENGEGRQHTKSKTWRPAPGMKEATADKQAEKQAVLFENQVKRGLLAYDSRTTLGEYAKHWIENEPLAPKTRERYWELYKRINAALGHIKLEKLQARHLEAFYKNLAERGVNKRAAYAQSEKLGPLLKKRGLSREALGKRAGVAASTVSMAARGERVSQKTAVKIAEVLEIPVGELFALHDSEKPLSDKTIQHHHRLLSAILEKAKRERLVPFNVAREHATAPKVQRKEAVYLDDEEARRFLSAVLEETEIRKKAAFVVLLFTGLRRGELCGLSWQDIDEERQIINVVRASQYQQGNGVVEVPTKTASSVRAVKVPAFVIEVLREYRAFWNRQRLAWGDAWQGEAGRLFVQQDGKPINPDTINYWLNDFLKRHGLEHITPHSLRHTFATLQIAAGVDIRTLQARTGHAQASTLVNIYSHALKSAQEAASDALESVLLPAKEG